MVARAGIFLTAAVLLGVVSWLGGCDRERGRATAGGERTLSIAAASSMKPAMESLVAAWGETEAGKGVRVVVTYGASGNLRSQLASGAPFDVFYSADTASPRALVDVGAGAAESQRVYAVGRLVVWVKRDSGLDVERGWDVLRDERVKHVAIANPEHAPYGRAAMEAMRGAGVLAGVESRLVRGENVEQAAQFAHSGAAQAAVIPLSLAKSARMTEIGTYWEVPSELHSAIEHGVVRVRGGAHEEAARAFDDFVAGGEGRRILEASGFAAARGG